MEACYINLQDITARRNLKKKQSMVSNWILVSSILFGVTSTILHLSSNSFFFTSGEFLTVSLLISGISLFFWYYYTTKNMETYIKVNTNCISWKYKIWSKPTVLSWTNIKDIEKVDEDIIYHLNNGKIIKMGLEPLGKTTITQVMNRIFNFSKSKDIIADGKYFKKTVKIEN